MIVDFTARSDSLKKPGLGDLFPIYSFGTNDTYRELAEGIFLTVATSQGKSADYASNIFSTDAIVPVIDATGIKMVCRFNDMIPGFPYDWSGYAYWMDEVTAATNRIKAGYAGKVRCIAPFNEPDNKMQGSFMSDPDVEGSTYDERINWLWTQTVRKIRSITPDIPIMGPNYEYYYPWERNGEDQQRMRSFLENAIATETVPEIIGWHKLGPSPGDVPFALADFYRPLEEELEVPGRPLQVMIEEFGPGTGDFEGVPGHMMKEMAELERARVDYGSMGIYTTSGQLGNTVRFPYDPEPSPNAGWYTLHWYKEMKGQYVPVSRWDQRYYQAYDGIASYDDQTQTATLILGGSDDLADITMKGIGALLGNQVHVRLEVAFWDDYPLEENGMVENGGDAGAPYGIFDKTFDCEANGDLVIPVHRIQQHHGYRILVTPAGSGQDNPTKYEAENAQLMNANVIDNILNASGNAYVTGINMEESSVNFSVNVTERGIYTMLVRYAASGSNEISHHVTVNGFSQGNVTYPAGEIGTAGEEMLLTKKRIALREGENTITFSVGEGIAELDFIDIRRDTHRYQAEYATINHANKRFFNRLFTGYNFVGNIDFEDSFVEFPLDVPLAGTYDLQVAYANGTSEEAIPVVTINNNPVDEPWKLPPTGGWLPQSPSPNGTRGIFEKAVYLTQGINRLRIAKGEGFAELDYINLTYSNETITAVDKPIQNTDSIHIFPNPAENDIRILFTTNTNQQQELLIYDFKGSILRHTKIVSNTTYSLSLDGMSAGLYVVTILQNGRLLGVKRFIKK